MPYPILSSGFFTAWDKKHFAQTELYGRKVMQIYRRAIKEAIKIAGATSVDPKKPFSFDDYPAAKSRAKNLFANMAKDLHSTILDGTEKSWLLSNTKNDDMVAQVFRGSGIPKKALATFYQRNLEGLSAFQSRKENGLGLSDKVWNYSQSFKSEIELGLDLGIGEGKSATKMARDMQQYLQQPDTLIRKIRDKHGNLTKAAKAFHPGQGVYRSSYKNSLRLTRTEVNMAYRASDHDRWQQMEFVIGVEVKTSHNHPVPDMCDDLSGKYPKDFKFVGWHPQCRCYVVPILADAEDFDKMQMAILNGEDPGDIAASGTIKRPPKGFTDWIDLNKAKIAKAKTLPYFIRDNDQYIKATKPKPKPKQRPKPSTNPATKAKPKPAAAPKEQIKGIVPDNLSTYEKKMDTKIDRSFFDHHLKPTKLTMSKGGSYFDSNKHTVNLTITNDPSRSSWKRSSVVYHEFGHAIDHQVGMRSMKEITDLMNKYRTKYADRLARLNSRTKIDYSNATINKQYDLRDQILAVRDTIKTLDVRYGAGHSDDYFRRKGMQEGEFIAHAFENKFKGNAAFKKYMPELYKEMIDVLGSILNKIK